MAKRPPKSTGSKSDASRVSEIIKQYQSFFSVTEDVRREMKEDMGFVQGGRKQWYPQDIAQLESDAEKRPILSFNITQAKVNFVTGLQQERESDYRYFPRGSEDEALGRIMTAQVKYVMDRCAGIHEEAEQFRTSYITGASVLEVAHSYDYTDDLLEGDICLTNLAFNSWYCDTLSRRYDRCDARHQGKLMWYGEDQAAKYWPEHAKRIVGMGDWFPHDPLTTGVPEHLLKELYDRETGRVRVLQHWYKVPVTATLVVNSAELDPAKAVTRMKDGKEAEAFIKAKADQAGVETAAPYSVIQTDQFYTLVNKQTGGMMTLADQNEGDRFIEQVRADAGNEAAAQFDIISRNATAMRVAHLTGAELLDDTPSPYDDDWKYPFSPFFCYNDGEDFGSIKGGVRDIKDPQREINWHHSTIVDTMARAPKGATWFDLASLGGDPTKLNEIKKKLPRAGFVGTYTGSMPQYWPPGSFSPGDLAMMEIASDFAGTITGTDNLQANPQQNTVSGRAIGARFAGGVVSLGTIFQHWRRTKEYTGTLLAKRVQQFHSPEKMDRILGQEMRMKQIAGLDLKMEMSPEMVYAQYKAIKELVYDVVVGFQDPTTTAREANLNRMMQMMAAGFPIPPDLIVEASDMPYKQEIQTALKQQGMQQPNEALSKVLSAGQGQSGADGVNTSQ